ncbi:hypothetical protein OTU49_012759 [Cherax quadricarinatus]|uniref:p53 DNA-binding domain-containing protein n=1 Tax=Cherax quadricarinatus TaxID=27406 RepID=A0AAW0VXM3_CHEQU
MTCSFDFTNSLISIEGDMDDPDMFTHLSEGKYINSFGDNETKTVLVARSLLPLGYQIMPEEFRNGTFNTPCALPAGLAISVEDINDHTTEPVYQCAEPPNNTGTEPQEPSNIIDTEPQAFERMIRHTSEDIRIYPLASEKTKNPPYLLKGKDITVKNLKPVTLIVEGCQGNDKLEISMRYMEEQFKTVGVYPCKNHLEESKMPEKDFNFTLITTPCAYKVIDDHPTALVDIKQELIDNGNFKFHIMFLCLNSCHRKRGKKIELLLKVFNPGKTALLKEEHINLRICKNVKRDYKEHSELGTKRKIYSLDEEQVQVPVKKMHMKMESCQSLAPCGDDPDDPLEQEICKKPLKIQKVEPEIHENSIIEAGLIDSIQIQQFMDSQPSSSTQQTQQYLFEMLSRDDEIMVVSLIKRLGGKYSLVPNDETVLGDRNFPNCNSLQHNFPNFVSVTQDGNTQLF